eukprot:CAMPEP_0204613776 /NCGR_PEP_ID=MMETSP0717-20131115/1691_1 /ASSEMBLY_ACC=CAM_ASM_000666 /TAXON_ID=230516 /ORGANISM="Chaetoceros curvisetus" /LENGTH=598 /DNA_ID=CAMNT_0051626309 /DNA_START=294 /DNA_END=2090 /DNA_ORIENTATION=-
MSDLHASDDNDTALIPLNHGTEEDAGHLLSGDQNTTIPTITKYSQLGDPPENKHCFYDKGWWLDTINTILLGFLTGTVLVCLVLLSPFLLFCSIIQRIHVARMRYHTPPNKQRVAVIGGGWSGLQCMARLHELGVRDVKGFERYDGWGGTWHPALRYHSLQIHGPMWVTSFKDFPYSKNQDVNDGKVLGEEALRYVDRFGKEKNLMEAYTFNAQVVEIKYSGSGSGSTRREATLVLKDSVTGKTWTEGPYDLVIFASQASEPCIPDIPGRKEFKGKIYHSINFKKEQYDDIVKSGKKVVVVGGSKAGCDLALSFQRGGYDKFSWLYRTPYIFWKYEVMFHNRSITNTLRGFTTIVALLMTLVSQRLSGWIQWTSGIAVTHGIGPPHNNWSKFHFGVLCPKQRRDLSSIPKECIIRGNPQAFTETGIRLSDGTNVAADVVLFATGCESGIDKIRLIKDSTPYSLQPTTSMLDHFLVPDFPVLANATTLWTTFGPVRAVNAADMAVYHLCIRRLLTEKEMQYSAKMWQLGKTNGVTGFLFQSHTSAIKLFVLTHLDLMFRGNVNVADFLVHVFQVFCLSKQTALKIRLPKLVQASIKKHD